MNQQKETGKSFLLGSTVCAGGVADYSRVAASTLGYNCGTSLKSEVTDVRRYNWEGDEPLRRDLLPD